MTEGLIGLDIGTTSIKGVLINTGGVAIHTLTKEYTLETDGDRCELDAELYWINSVFILNALALEAYKNNISIEGLSFSCQGETLICLDAAGLPLRKAIVWLDNRSNTEAKEIWDHFGINEINRVTGQTEILPFWTASRIRWLEKNE